MKKIIMILANMFHKKLTIAMLVNIFHKKITYVILGIILLCVFVLFQTRGNILGVNELGGNLPDAQWMNINQFSGYKTNSDPSKIDIGANPNGQNTIINDGDRISIRDFGSTILGTSTTTADGVTSLHTFRRRNGENIMMRSRGTYLEYYEEGNDSWEVLGSSYTSGKKFGYADFNINADLRSYVYFGNGNESFSRWTGAHTLTNGSVEAASTTIIVDDTSNFDTTGTIIYCGTELAYSGKTSTTFTVASAHVCADNKGVAQAVATYASNPKGNIYLVANNRLFISGVASTTQAVFFSKYADATDFSIQSIISDATDDDPGIFNLGEGGGGVVGMVLDEGSVYIFKKSIIYKVTLTDTLYTLVPLKPFDGKSQTTGATNNESTFTGKNGVYFITPDRQIMNLQRIESVDYPQVTPISDIIKPSINASKFATSTGIYWQDKAYIAAESNYSSVNDVVFVWNDKIKTWESPIIGWSVGAWTIYDDGTGEALYFGDFSSANVFKVTSDALDNGLGVTANWRSKRFDMDIPMVQKEIDNVWVEGYISPNTTLKVTLYYDYNGYTQTYEANILGTETSYLYDAEPLNTLGYHPFGYEQFGSSNQDELKRFRVYLSGNLRRTPFYDFSIEFASDGEGQAWQVLGYGVHWRPTTQPELRTLYRNWE